MDYIQKHRDEQNARITGSYNQPTLFEKGEESDLEKSEGSRGGKVIGHTKPGKAIYEHHEQEHTQHYTAEDHSDAMSAHMKEAKKHTDIAEKTGGFGEGMLANHKKHNHSQMAALHQGAMNQKHDKGIEKSEESDPIELRKSELEEEIGRLSHVIQSRINSDNGANYITKGMQSDLTKSKRELAYIKQYGELSK